MNQNVLAVISMAAIILACKVALPMTPCTDLSSALRCFLVHLGAHAYSSPLYVLDCFENRIRWDNFLLQFHMLNAIT